jgi:hypothetical protein
VSPPTREKPALADRLSHIECITNANQCKPSGRQAVHDALGAIRRRPYKPSTGLRASGYREGYAAALRWILRDLNLDAVTSARLAAIVAPSEDS